MLLIDLLMVAIITPIELPTDREVVILKENQGYCIFIESNVLKVYFYNFKSFQL